MLGVAFLDDGSPDPTTSNEGHHKDIREFRTIVKRGALPIQEGTHDQGGENLRKASNKRSKSTRPDGEVERNIGSDIRKAPVDINEQWRPGSYRLDKTMM